MEWLVSIKRNIFKKFHPNREVLSVSKKQVDLRNQLEVNSLVSNLNPDEIIVSKQKLVEYMLIAIFQQNLFMTIFLFQVIL